MICFREQRLKRSFFILALLAIVTLGWPAPAGAWLTYVTQYENGVDGVDGLDRAWAVDLSPDGRHAYVAGYGDEAIAAFSRDADTGELTFLACYKDGEGGVEGMDGPQFLAVSPDGKNVYVAVYRECTLAVFRRDEASGALTFVEYHEDGKNGVNGLGNAQQVTVSPDGNHVYVAASDDDSVALFNRDADTGKLTYVTYYKDGQGVVEGLNKAKSVVVSPDGKNVYASGNLDNAVVAFGRNETSGELTYMECYQDGEGDVDGLDGAHGLAVSPDGKNVYAIGEYDNAVALFNRDLDTGRLTYVTCYKNGQDGIEGLAWARGVAVSPDSLKVYATSSAGDALVVFERDKGTGELTFIEFHQDSNDNPGYPVVSPDNKHVYVSYNVSSTVSLFQALSYSLTVNKDGTGVGAVNSDLDGIDCGSDCSEIYVMDTEVTLTASPSTGSSFLGWSGGGCSGAGTCEVMVDQAKTITAQFTLNHYTLSVNITGSGNVSSDLGNIACGSACSDDYDYNTLVALNAIPDAGWSFSGWSGGVCSGTGTCEVTIDQAKTVTADFTANRYTLSVNKTGTGVGTVSADSGSIACGSACFDDYDYNTLVTLSANAGAGSGFSGWSGACSGTGTCEVTVDQTKAVTAGFALNRYGLSVGKTGTGQGTVTSDLGSIACGSACSDDFDYNTTVALIATPAAGSSFSGWSGGVCSGTGNCQVTVDQAKAVTAEFSLNQYNLSVSKTGTGEGTVNSDVGNIVCGSSCSDDYDYNTRVTLSAGPSTGSSFSGWTGGGCSGTGTCEATLAQAKTVTAEFSLNQYTLSVSKTGTGEGTVTSDLGNIACGNSCSEGFDYNTRVRLSAAASTGSSFSGWSGGGCSGTGTCEVTAAQAKTVTAEFSLNQYTLSISKTGTGEGKVTSDAGGIVCGSACSDDFDYTARVTLRAIPKAGSSFTGWTGGGCSGTGTCEATVVQAQNITAEFSLNQYTLSVSKTGTGEGTVTSDLGNIACGSACSDDYDYNTRVSLRASPSGNSYFSGWSGGDCSDAGTCEVTVDEAQRITAEFTLNQYSLSVRKTGTGEGTVTSDSGSIDCGLACSGDYDDMTLVALTAIPKTGSSFSGWSGGGCSGAGTCEVTVDDARTVTAEFTLNQYSLSVGKTGTGEGTVTSDSGSIDCGLACSGDYDDMTQVTLRAIPKTGSSFSGWSGGGCSGAGTCEVTVDEARTITAKFSLNQYSLSISKIGSGEGTVTADSGSLACGLSCSDDYDYMTQVALTASPSTGSSFSGWSGGDCSGAGTCEVTVDEARTITAEFSLNQYTLSVSKIGSGEGTVTSDSGSIDCGLSCSDDYDYMTRVTLRAAAGAESYFSGWSGGSCSGTGDCTVAADEDKTVTARFSLNQYTLTVNREGPGSGTVTADLGDIDCGSTCFDDYDSGDLVTLTAAADRGSRFVGWSGDCSGSDARCSVTIEGAATVTAAFNNSINLAPILAPLLGNY